MIDSGTARADSRVRTPRGERSREAILNAAMELFAEQGYETASMLGIAARAQLSKSVIYDHFGSKADLHRALLEREADALLSDLARAVPPPDASTPRERLRCGIEAFFRYAEDRPVAWRLLIRDPPAAPELAAAHYQIQRRGTDAVAVLIAGEHLDDPRKRLHKEMLAELLKSSITGLAVWWSEHPDVPREQLVDTVYEFAWLGLQHQVGARGLPEPRPA